MPRRIPDGSVGEVAFRHNGHVAFQIQLAKKQDAVSLTGDDLITSDTQDQLVMNAA